MGQNCMNPSESSALNPLPQSDKLYVMTSFFMPVYSQARVDLYKNFEKHMKEFPKVELWTIECALPGRDFVVTAKENQRNLQVRGEQALWIKENLLSILAKRIPLTARNLAWIDADVTFQNKNWVEEALEKLQKCDIVQLFEYSEFLGLSGRVQTTTKSIISYAKQFPQNLPQSLTSIKQSADTSYPAHPGYGWAISSSYLTQISCFLQFCIVGGADTLMAYSVLGLWQQGLEKHFELTQEFLEEYESWARKAIPQNGYDFVSGTIAHNYHGERRDRGYVSRWGLLEKYGYRPKKDLLWNEDGVLYLSGEQSGLQDSIMQYFVSRKDDIVKPKKLPAIVGKKVEDKGEGVASGEESKISVDLSAKENILDVQEKNKEKQQFQSENKGSQDKENLDDDLQMDEAEADI